MMLREGHNIQHNMLNKLLSKYNSTCSGTAVKRNFKGIDFKVGAALLLLRP